MADEQARTGPRLRGLIVDWGGVLTVPLDQVMSRWAASDGVQFEDFRELVREWAQLGEAREQRAPGRQEAEPFMAAESAPETPTETSPIQHLERGEITPGEFEQALVDELATRGSTVSAAGLLNRMLGGLDQVSDMLGLIRRAHAAGLRTALLSNSWGDHYPEDTWEGLFDAVVISGRVGMRKPEARIFRHTADLLGLRPEDCVMVDDLPHNVRGAVAAGMVGVLHHSYEETALELEALFDLPLR